MTAEPHLSRLARGGALNLVGAASAGIMGLALVFVVAHAYGAWVHARICRRADRQMYLGSLFLRNRPALG